MSIKSHENKDFDVLEFRVRSETKPVRVTVYEGAGRHWCICIVDKILKRKLVKSP